MVYHMYFCEVDKMEIECKSKKRVLFKEEQLFKGYLDSRLTHHYYSTVIYDSHRDCIIECSGDSELKRLININGKFYRDPEYEHLWLQEPATSMTYNEKLDTYLIGCSRGLLYVYDPNRHFLISVGSKRFIDAIMDLSFISDRQYVFVGKRSEHPAVNKIDYDSSDFGEEFLVDHIEDDEHEKYGSKVFIDVLCVGDIEKESVTVINESQITCLLKDKEKNIIYVGNSNGEILVYEYNIDVGLKLINKEKVHDNSVVKIIDCTNNKFKKIASLGENNVVKIMDVKSGKLCVIKTINNGLGVNDALPLKNQEIIYLKRADIIIYNSLHFLLIDVKSGNKIDTNISIHRDYYMGCDQKNKRQGYDFMIFGHIFVIGDEKIGIAEQNSDEMQMFKIMY